MNPALVLSIILAGNAPAASHAATTTPPSKLECAGEGEEESSPARLEITANGGKRLFVCAVNAKRRKGALELTGFRVFVTGRSGKKRPKKVFESDLETRVFRVTTAKHEIHANELVWDGKENTPAFETVIGCDAHGCHASNPPKCVFEKPKPGSRRVLEQVGEYQHGTKQGKVPPKKLLDSLAALAYSGDEDAQAFFRDRGALSLDGESSDTYFDHQASLERLQKAGCL